MDAARFVGQRQRILLLKVSSMSSMFALTPLKLQGTETLMRFRIAQMALVPAVGLHHSSGTLILENPQSYNGANSKPV